MRRPIALAFAAVLALASCASAPPAGSYSVVDGTDYDRTDPYAAPVEIAGIDGKSYMRLYRRALPPGKHEFTFLTTQVLRATRIRTPHAIELDLKPCTAYYYYAQHPSKFDSQWELKLLREVPLEGCAP